jgi:hypothetical protein
MKMAEIEFTDEQQKYVDKLVGKARKEGREAGKSEVQDELDALKTVAQERETELEELKGKHGKASETLETVLDKRVEGMGEGVRSALDSLPFDTLEKLEWLDEHADAFVADQSEEDEEEDKGPGTPKRAPKKDKPKSRPKPRRRVSL